MTAPGNFEDYAKEILNAEHVAVDIPLDESDAYWLRAASAETGIQQTDYLNDAIAIAGMQQLALTRGMQIVAKDAQGQIHELPYGVRQTFNASHNCSFYVTTQNFLMLHWMEQRGAPQPDAVHRGLRILGRAATASALRLVTTDSSQDYAYSLPALPRLGNS
jgi:hypothetical protein